MKYICPVCRTQTSRMRCPGCGSDTVPLDDVKPDAFEYLVFQHAQKGHTPSMTHLDAEATALAAKIQVGDLVRFSYGGWNGGKLEPKIGTGHIVALNRATQVVTAMRPGGDMWRVCVCDVVEVVRHLVAPHQVDGLKASGWTLSKGEGDD